MDTEAYHVDNYVYVQNNVCLHQLRFLDPFWRRLCS